MTDPCFDPGSSIHITDDQVLLHISREKRLGRKALAHIRQCGHCRFQLEKAEKTFNEVGAIARENVPSMAAPVRLPEKGTSSSIRSKSLLPAGLVMAGMAIFIFFITTHQPQLPSSPQQKKEIVFSEKNIENDDQLINQVNTLVEDAMPEKYQDLIMISKESGVFDSMLDMVPEVDDVPHQSFHLMEKGDSTC